MSVDLTAMDPTSMAEQAVLGALMIDPRAIQRVVSLVIPEDFVVAEHAALYRAMLALHAEQKPCDVVTLYGHLRDGADATGGPAYWAALSAMTPTSLNAEHYARTVQESRRRRLLAAHGERLMAGSRQGGTAPTDLANEVGQSLAALSLDADADEGAQHVSAFIGENFEELGKQYTGLVGVSSGISKLDDYLQGFRGGNLIIIAGRPGLGKSAMVMTIAHHVAVVLRRAVAFFSLEMTRAELGDRLLSLQAHIPSELIRSHRLTDGDLERAADATARISESPLYIHAKPGITVTQMRAQLRSILLTEPLALVIVDYLQLMGNDGKRENRTQEVSAISRDLKGAALEFDVPLIALCQLNRATEMRTNHEPVMADIRETGSIEADADIVMLLSRKGAYDPDGKEDRGIAHLHIAKHRNGPTGKVQLHFEESCMRFTGVQWGGS